MTGDTHASGDWVLVVDDDDDIREILSIILGEYGFQAEGAADGLDALDRLRAGKRPTLILLDLMMPRLSGVDLLKTLSDDPRLADIPVLVLSGDGGANEAATALGARACLRKPVDLDELVGAVRRHSAAPPP